MFSARFLTGLVVAWCLPFAHAYAFDFEVVTEKARALAKQPYEAPEPAPQFLRDLSFNQYQEIRFQPEKSLWRESGSRFQVMLLAPGLFYTHAVPINVVDAQGVHQLPFDKAAFNYPNEEFAKRIPADLGYAGFKLTYPLKQEDVQSQFLVFAGASYFRGVGRDNGFGISARGIAVNTGLPSGEEFPSFVEFWLVRPAPDAKTMTFYALLDGPSLTGAYRFQVHPGEKTSLEVSARLFPRDKIELLGVAPLTSMFYYGENTIRPAGEWRPQVHDSDGLLIHDGPSGEWLWRPLINPRDLRMSYLQTGNVQGFGLLQRDEAFIDYQDMSARYDQRPSAWVEPEGDWGKGQVVLVEIPTRSESNDNIVAFWRPDDPVTADQPLQFDYTVYFGPSEIPGQPNGRAINTFVGDGNRLGGGDVEGAYRFIIDFAGGPLEDLGAGAAVLSKVSGGEGVEVIEHFAEYLDPVDRWRISILARPAPNKPLSLRAYLSLEDKALTETWTYELPPGVDIRGEG